MFILTNINPRANQVTILDTKDNVSETVALYPVAQQINAGQISVVGLKSGNELPPFNLKLSIEEAKTAYVKHFAYINKLTEDQAHQLLKM